MQEWAASHNKEAPGWLPASEYFWGRTHYYEGWNVLPNRDKTALQSYIQGNDVIPGPYVKPGTKWRDAVNADAKKNLEDIVKNASPEQQAQAQTLLDNVTNAQKTAARTKFASADDRFGISPSYWKSKLGNGITGIKFVARAVFVQKLYAKETLQETFGDSFNYGNNFTGAGPFLQSIGWGATNDVPVTEIRMNKFLKTHSHSAGIDHILTVTWNAGKTTVRPMGP